MWRRRTPFGEDVPQHYRLPLPQIRFPLADALLLTASGHSYLLRLPLTDVAPPTPGLYLSTDGWPSMVLGGLALVVWVVDRRVVHQGSSR